jgi:AraC family transcriptional regulator
MSPVVHWSSHTLADVVVATGHVPGGTRFRRHHHDAAHVVCVLEGGFVETVRAGVEDVGPGTVRISPAARHDIAFAPAGARCLVLTLGGDSALAGTDRSLFLRDTGVSQLAARLEGSLRNTDPAGRLASDDLLAELLARIPRRRSKRTSPEPPSWLTRARERIADEHGRHPGLSRLAEQAGVDRAHFARAFREHYGTTLGAFARRLRVRRALHLLGDDRSLADVALEAGFADQSHLTRVFAALLGASPGLLRKAAGRPQRIAMQRAFKNEGPGRP